MALMNKTIDTTITINKLHVLFNFDILMVLYFQDLVVCARNESYVLLLILAQEIFLIFSLNKNIFIKRIG